MMFKILFTVHYYLSAGFDILLAKRYAFSCSSNMFKFYQKNVSKIKLCKHHQCSLVLKILIQEIQWCDRNLI